MNFEDSISQLTRPINGQLPRPWITKMANPEAANVFIVGKNQAKSFDASLVSHDRHMNALFNRNGETCRGLYDEQTGGNPSPTRKNIDTLVAGLEHCGALDILETNVICYSTPMSDDLKQAIHAGGAAQGEEIFRFLVGRIKPKVVLVHGAGASKQLAKVMAVKLPPEPTSPEEIVFTEADGCLVARMPSLAPPAYNRWCRWAPEYLSNICKAVAGKLSVL